MSPVLFSARRWFSAARFLILTHILVGVIITTLNLPAAYKNLRNLTPGLGFQGWTAAQLQSAAKASGVATGVLATVLFVVGLICLLSFWGVAALLAWRKSDTWIGLLIIYILAGTGPGFSFLGQNIGANASGFFALYQKIGVTLIWPSFFVLLYLFPDGRFVPRLTRWLAPLPYLTFFLALWIDPKNIILTAMQWLLIFYAVGGITSQLFRYRRVSVPTQRQQTKWVVYALGILVVGIVTSQAFPLLDSGLSIGTPSRFWFDLLGNYLFGAMGAALIPLSIGISILRYQLWDIDLIIRRTLVYAILTAALGLVFYGGVTLLQWLFTAFIGQQSPASIVISTLVIVVLFIPLRRRVQGFIDRRFYRQKYDAARTLEAFSTAVRNEVNLVELSGHLEKVVEQAVQPKSVTLWMRQEKQ